MGLQPWSNHLDQVLSNICTIPISVDRLKQKGHTPTDPQQCGND
jgi:hypothetical protein